MLHKFKKRIVHLGNIGYGGRLLGRPILGEEGRETREYAKNNPSHEVIGIDKMILNPDAKIKNWRQIRASFTDGLKGLENNSVHEIVARHTLGYYNEKGEEHLSASLIGRPEQKHTKEVLKTAYQKLLPRGKVRLIVASRKLANEIAKLASEGTGFSKDNIIVKPLDKVEIKNSFWSKAYSTVNFFLFRRQHEVILEK